MRCAILTGFEYKDSKKLPGILVDLYQVYCFLKKLGWEDSEIFVYTDIQKDKQTGILKAAILEKLVDSNILSFIEDIKEKNQYISFKNHNHYNNFESIFLNFSKYDNLFIYFSGHSKDKYFLLPNDSLYSIISFRNILKSKQIIVVMDCCEGGLNLPFVLNDIYRLKNEKSFVKPEIICIASSLNNEKSTISKSGSFFTRYLFNILDNMNMNISEILNEINKKLKETSNVSVSYPNLYYIFPWLYRPINIKIIHHPYFISITI